MSTWEAEKARNARRAAELAAEMQAAIETLDQPRFAAAYSQSMRYMKKRVRSYYFKTFCLMSSVNR